jgi:serine/threonine protein kinase
MSLDELNTGAPGERFSDFYHLQEVLGQGSFGLVVHATDLATLEHVAVKVIRKDGLPPTKWNEFR